MDEDLLIISDAGLKCHCHDGEDKDVLSSLSLTKKRLSFWIKSLCNDLDVMEHIFHEKQNFCLLSHIPHCALCILAAPSHRGWTFPMQRGEGPALEKVIK